MRQTEDPFDALLFIEESIIEHGEKLGMIDGRLEGQAEGAALGVQKGNEIGTEVGYYAGSLAVYKNMAHTMGYSERLSRISPTSYISEL